MDSKKKKSKQTYTPTLRYKSFEEAFQIFIDRHCVPATTMEWGANEMPYISSEIRIVLNESGGGYIHLLGKDSETIEFQKIR
jgi:hypothetical protein